MISRHLVSIREIAGIREPFYRSERLKEWQETLCSEFEHSFLSVFWETFTANGRSRRMARYFDWFFGMVSLSNQTSIHMETKERLMLIALELGIFQRKNGHWPKSLEELGLPDELLTDPFTGKKTLTYRLNEEKEKISDSPWLLYSWGKNQTDEGGKVWKGYDEEAPEDEEEEELMEDEEEEEYRPTFREENTGDVVWGTENRIA